MPPSPQFLGGVHPSVMFVTVAFIFLGSFASEALGTFEPYLVLGMMLLLGLPHGATDHGLFLALRKDKRTDNKLGFYLRYVGVIAAYGLVWYFIPLVAFSIFILLSVYHFGQSSWVNVKHRNPILARAHYIVWGAGILLTPILIHTDEAVTIVATMTSTVLKAPEHSTALMFIGLMGLVNTIVLVSLWLSGSLDKRRMMLEVLAYALLMGMFFTNSLLLGFTVYFVFWHSLASARDQLQFFERRLSPDLRRQLYGEIAMTVLGALAFCLIVWFGPGPESALQPSVIGGVFIVISLLTMPHMILVEQLYTSWSPDEELNPPVEIDASQTKNHIHKSQSVASTTGW